jgi:hypothetical protein
MVPKKSTQSKGHNMAVQVRIISFDKNQRIVKGVCENNNLIFSAIAEKINDGVVIVTIQEDELHCPPFRLAIPKEQKTQDLIVGHTYTHNQIK